MTNRIIKPIRSFVLREGRLTRGQQRALKELWPVYGVELEQCTQKTNLLPTLFRRSAPLVIEIGFGDGETLIEIAEQSPEKNFIGIEVHRPGIGHLMLRAEALNLQNLKVLCADAVEVIRQAVPDQSVDQFNLYFPDPWPKKKHHKRRMLQPDFASLISNKLKQGGIFHFVTDCEDYAKHALATLNETRLLLNCDQRRSYSPRPESRPLTKFERRGLNLGHGVWDIIMKKSAFICVC